MAINNMTLPELIARIDAGSFGKLEGRMSHYGAINILYRNALALFGAELMALIRKQPFTRTIKIPIFDKYDHTVLTVRSCNINCQDIGTRLKALTRTHLAVDLCINPSDYDNNYVMMEQALKHRATMAMKAVYTKIDEMGAAFFDLNKDTTMVPDAGGVTPNANPLFTAKAGRYELPNSLRFYTNLVTIMEQMDINGPFIDLANTVALADQNVLTNPGNGALLATDRLFSTAQLQQFEYSNRVAVGSNKVVHYIAPVGSVGIVNIIDPVYQDKPVIGSPEDFAQWESFGNKTELKAWGQMPDPVYNDWDWGVLQEVTCVDETILYKTKLSADFTLAADFTSVAGESPIKRFDIAAMAFD